MRKLSKGFCRLLLIAAFHLPGVLSLEAVDGAEINIGAPIVNPYPDPYITTPLQPESRPITSTVVPAVTVRRKAPQKSIVLKKSPRHRRVSPQPPSSSPLPSAPE
jgi:hypothetical protein